ncbi:MAG TPA: lasso RiPP family leader peptide-containing protein [Thermoanaerobaculia bacterium]|nr:lasso RiPP family leader peptide-containing protein [Thermoanaerobaculia bacterium]
MATVKDITPGGTCPEKRAYEAPELTEWGSIRDLTQGTKSGKKDFPKAGGSTGV